MAGDIGIVIVAHGQLAHEYRAAVEHVVGPQPNIVAVSIAAECDRNNKENGTSQQAGIGREVGPSVASLQRPNPT